MGAGQALAHRAVCHYSQDQDLNKTAPLSVYQLVLNQNCTNYQPVDLKLNHQLRETNGSTGSGSVSWCTIGISEIPMA